MAALNRIMMNIISCFSPVKCIQYPLTVKAKFKHKAKNNYVHFCSNFFSRGRENVNVSCSLFLLSSYIA